MLHNPKYDKPSLLTMLLFAEGKPADKAYPFMNPRRCACAQFSHALGMVGQEWWSTFDDNTGMWGRLNLIAREHPRTFGALAARLRCQIY